MIDKKYIIAVGLIILLLVIYYFYDDIRNIKKNLIPMYEKTMKLENKIEELEKKFSPNKNSVKRNNNTPVFSISYQSETNKVPQKHHFTESEAKRIVERINQNIEEIKVPEIRRVKKGELSDFNEEDPNKSEIINIPFSDFMGNKDELKEYNNILNGLKNSISPESGLFSNDELDKKIMRDISESIHNSRISAEELSSSTIQILKKNDSMYNL
jgi:hypothetical protein